MVIIEIKNVAFRTINIIIMGNIDIEIITIIINNKYK